MHVELNNGNKAPVKVFYEKDGLAVIMPTKLTYDDNLLKRWAGVLHLTSGKLILTTATILGARKAMNKLLTAVNKEGKRQDWTQAEVSPPFGFERLTKQYRTR